MIPVPDKAAIAPIEKVLFLKRVNIENKRKNTFQFFGKLP